MRIRVSTGESAGSELTLEDGRSLILGREQGCDLIVRDPRASRRHAEIRSVEGGRVRVRDLGSANGTWVGDDRIEEAVLAPGQEVRIGDVRLAVVPGDPPRTAAPAPTYSMIGRLVDSHARRTNRIMAAATGLALLGTAGAAAFAFVKDAPPERVPAVVAGLTPSTVLIESLRDGGRTGTGSGWVLDAPAGLVVTNAHVLNQGDSVRVAAGGRRRPARVVAVAPCEDVALLRLEDSTGLRTASLASRDGVRQGQTVVALGFAAGAQPADEPISTTGVVSSSRAAYLDAAPDVPPLTDAVRTDTALNPGNSGGPLVDLDGRIVGMNSAVRSTGEDGRALQNENYAIGAQRLRTTLAGLRTGRSAGWTGLTFSYPTAEQLARRHLPAGLLVTGAVAGTPAARAGLGRTAEALVNVDGRAAGTTLSSYCAALGARAPTRLTFASDGSGKLRQVRLGTS
jgi:S1-C subfamily serine protease